MEDSAASEIRRLIEREVPEVANGRVEVMSIAREACYQSKMAIRSMDNTTDSVAACVGVRGKRIKNVIDALAGERIDLVRWSDDTEMFIRSALQPAEIEAVVINEAEHRATVFVRRARIL